MCAHIFGGAILEKLHLGLLAVSSFTVLSLALPISMAVPEVLAHVACSFSPADVEDDKVGRLTSCIACAQTASAERRSSGKAAWISPKETLSR